MPAIWLFVVTIVPILLLAAIVWGRVQQTRRDQRVDPRTPSDDPAKGMS